MLLKRSICSFSIILILCMIFLTGYTISGDFVYADSTTDSWTQVTTNQQLVEAFRYYCKSRDLTIEGSVADAVTSFSTKTFNGICNTLGIDVTALQAQIKYQTDGNTGLRFLFSATGVNAFNRIFAQFLQDNDLEVGDSPNNDVIYSNEWFVDNNGNGCYVYIINTSTSYMSGTGASVTSKQLSYGTPYYFDDVYDFANYFELNRNYWTSLSVSAGNTNYTYYFRVDYRVPTTESDYCYVNDAQTNSAVYTINYFAFRGTSILALKGTPVIYKNLYNNSYYFGEFSQNNNKANFNYRLNSKINFGTQTQPSTVNIYINTNNVINNNVYEGDTIINNNGDVINNTYNPYPDGGGGTTPPTNTGGGSGEDDGTITFPDFDFHLPEINWSLGDLSEKFPFSIPFDLIAFFTVLNAEPQAPAINADIPLGTWYTWHFEADFSQFDNYAVIIRNVEFIGFCVGLIYLTIKLVKG